MVTTRTTDELQQEYLEALSRSGSGLVIDRVEGSLAYTLSRASAALAARQDFQLQELENNFSLLLATGTNLDQLGSPYLARTKQTKASGWALFRVNSSSPYTLPANTLLIDMMTGNRYETSAEVNASPFVEVPVAITALDYGVTSNIAAGSPLYCPSILDATFIVGYRRYNGDYQGDIINGLDSETDSDYRTRLLNYFASPPSGTNSHLKSVLLQNALVSNVFIKTPSPGFVEVWVNPVTELSESAINSIYAYVEPYVTAGSLLVLNQTKRVITDLSLAITPYQASRSDLTALSNQIRAFVNEHFAALSLEQPLGLSSLRNKLRPLARYVRVLSPTQEYAPQTGELLYPGKIEVSYPIN